jgi:hypothetical protein
MQARKESAANHQPEISQGIFDCRRKNTNVSYFGRERRSSREQFNNHGDWWLKVNFVERA